MATGNVSISGISITGGAAGEFADPGAGSLGLTVPSNEIDATITDSTIRGSATNGIYIAADRPTISGNTIYGNVQSGVETLGQDPTIDDNVVYGNGTEGIDVGFSVIGMISSSDEHAQHGRRCATDAGNSTSITVTGNQGRQLGGRDRHGRW